MDAMDAFYEAIDTVYSQPVKDWKAAGGAVVATLCSFVPVELFHAAGILPVRLRGVDADSLDIANAYYGPFICSCPKAILQMVCEGRYQFLDGAVITPGCDSMRRLDDCWHKAAGDYEGIRPPFFTYLGVPHKASDYAIEWFTEELRGFIRRIESHFQVNITKDKLKEAIRTYNRGRELTFQLQALREQENPAISGTDALAAAIAGTALPRAAYNEGLESLIDNLTRGRAAPAGKAPRLMVLGSVCDDTKLIRLIEDAGAVVVADNLCFGMRQNQGRVPATGPEADDPVAALARWYLSESRCPRMFGGTRQRLARIREEIEKAGVDGVIFQNIRFCDLHGAENGIFAGHLKLWGIPSLSLEREYGPLVDTGRIRMRVEAFLERVSDKKPEVRTQKPEVRIKNDIIR